MFVLHFEAEDGGLTFAEREIEWFEPTRWRVTLQATDAARVVSVTLAVKRPLPAGYKLYLFHLADDPNGWATLCETEGAARVAWRTGRPGAAAFGILLHPAGARPGMFNVGDAVRYRTREGGLVPARVVTVLNSVFPVSYGIQLKGSDNIRETEADRLLSP
jgi:hypothetical protein